MLLFPFRHLAADAAGAAQARAVDHERIQALEDVHLIGHITREELGQVLVTRDNQEFELKAQGWNPLK